MSAPACDRPPFDTAAIVAYAEAGALSPGIVDPRSPARAPRGGTRRHHVRAFSNVAQDLSITRARAESVVLMAMGDLQRYSRFLKGWDGYDGEPIARAALDLAARIIEGLRMAAWTQRLTDIIPGPAADGSLDLELRTTVKQLTITIYANGEMVEVRTFRVCGNETEEKHDVEQDALVADLRWLLS